VSFWGEGPLRIDEAEGRVETELALVEEAGDDLGAAWAWAVLGSFTWGRTQAAESKRAWRRAVDLFWGAGDQHMAGEYLAWLTATPVWGPTPCVQALKETEAYAVELGGSLAAEAEVKSTSATLFWMMGDFDEARRRSEAGHRGRLELGRPLADAHMSQVAGWIELMAGHALEAESILGQGARDLAALGSAYSARLLSAMHAQSLYLLGRHDEADEAAIVGWRGAEGDVTTQVLSFCVRAMVAARRGSFEDAERMAREAIAMIDQGDFINDQADARIALAEVLQLAGRVPEAAEAIQEALARYRTKGNVTQAAMAESRLAELRT
jgi:tetratricopeptide (TPR) repeat protein